ncbi:TniQ family protein [Bradyrhizobium sp. BRP14]|nr:TniQ family protein [Bradyrhizobium sp. BRP14]
MTSLSLRLPFHADETLSSYCSRTAAAHGINNARTFAGHMGFGFEGLANGMPADVATFGRVANLDARALESGMIRKDGALTYVGGQSLTKPYFQRTPLRFCPHCVDEDAASGAGRPGARAYGRKSWLVTLVRCCPVHGTKLVTSEIGGTTLVNDFIIRLNWEGPHMARHRLKSTPAKPTPLEQYVLRRIDGVPTNHDFLDALPLHVAAHITQLVGVIRRHGIWPKARGEHFVECSDDGFDIMSGGEERFREFLRSLHANSQGGSIRSVYGLFHKALTERVSDRSYDRVRSVVRDVAMSELPYGPGDDVFGPVETRKWHSVQSLSQEFGLGVRKVEALLRVNGFLGADAAPSTPMRTLVDAEAAAGFLTVVKDTVAAAAAAKYLGMPLIAFRQVHKAGYLTAHHVKNGGTGPAHFFTLPELERFSSKLRQCVTVNEVPAGAVNLIAARRRTQTSADQLVELLMNGRLKTVAWDPSRRGYGALLMDPREVRRTLRPRDPKMLTVLQARKVMQAPDHTIRNLILHGHLKAQAVPYRTRSKHLISMDDLQSFLSEHISVFHLARDFRTHVRGLTGALKKIGVEPAFDRALIDATYYRRKEIEAHASAIASSRKNITL